MGETSICFLPGADETKSCTELAADSTKAKTSCYDQAALKARMVKILIYLTKGQHNI